MSSTLPLRMMVSSEDDCNKNNNNNNYIEEWRKPFVESYEKRQHQIESTLACFHVASSSSSSSSPKCSDDQQNNDPNTEEEEEEEHQTVLPNNNIWNYNKDIDIIKNHSSTSSKTKSSSSSLSSWVLRTLYDKEIEALKGICCCSCKDWSKIRLLLPKDNDSKQDQVNRLVNLLYNNTFHGVVVIGIAAIDDEYCDDDNAFDASSSFSSYSKLPFGIKNNTFISNCIIEPNCRIYNNTIIENTYCCSFSIIVNCGRIVIVDKEKENNNYNTISITVGAESGGGRNLSLNVECTMIDVCNCIIKNNNENENKDNKGEEEERTISSKTTTPFRRSRSSFMSTLSMDDTSSHRTAVACALENNNNDNDNNNSYYCNYNIICSYAVINDTPYISNIYCSSYTKINNANSIKYVTMLPYSKISHGCVVSDTKLQWHACINDNSFVKHTLCMEYSHVGPSSPTISNSVLGPDVHVSNGEVHSSILGCNTNSHHQSLIIGMIWLLGRGNVAYGSNIGSNHTGRLPDQEIVVGEGIFWGLSCVVKYPINLLYSPYSLIAAGTTLIPGQFIYCMPFSLLLDNNNNSSSIQTTTMILPGWVLKHSLYTIQRNEIKFASRRKAIYHKYYTGYKIIRPSIINMCLAARDALLLSSSAAATTTTQLEEREENSSNNKAYYTEKDIMFIGKNCLLTEKGRLDGIKIYTSCIQRYALHGLYKWILKQKNNETTNSDNIMSIIESEFNSNNNNNDDNKETNNTIQQQNLQQLNTSWPVLPWEEEDKEDNLWWNHQKLILQKEFPPPPFDAAAAATDTTTTTTLTTTQEWIVSLLEMLIKIENEYAYNIKHCKERDDIRGAKTIPGYNDCHILANDDKVVLSVQDDTKQLESNVKMLIDKINI